MKKVLSVFILAAVLLMSADAGAQIKIGYIRIDDMVASMPETAKIDSILEKYQSDSINPRYAQIVSLYQYKDSVYRDSVKPAPPAVKKQIEEELPSLIYQIQNWQQIVNQAIETRQNELLAPIYRKVYDAIRAVAKEKGYTHVMTKEALLVAPDADDIIGLVAAKLKVTLPKAK
ncbi:MAG TPA: OmpH family outer membrane protein [Chitinophagaceae bacterium]|jgi:outer membrane protein|nr:OmpH family outer membrane protein [Chitinophagaceae bacterium]HRG91656.1 OmpH family outer membrane protein [Chitinophagaceae bacterium]